ncbi:MAG: hypothetical protein PHI84_22245, partial [Kiritimatiellae bacterium]|nr:hypothetical protein [Kiritimatiellia bacterium]
TGKSVTYQWDACGGNRMSAVIDIGGRVERRFSYDDKQRLVKIEHPDGFSCGYEWNDADRIVCNIFRDGTKEYMEYDDQGRMTKRTNAAGESLTRTYTQSGSDTVITETDDGGHKRILTYYLSGALKSFQDYSEALYRYDYNGNNQATRVRLPNGSSYLYAYDSRGNMVSKKFPDGSCEQYSWHPVFNKTTSFTDRNGNIFRYEYDGRGHLIKKINPDGATATMSYDERGLMLQATDFEGRVTKFEYDGNRYLSAIEDAAGSKVTFSRDAYGNVLKTTDELGRETGYSYNFFDQVTGISRECEMSESFTYSPTGNLIAYTDPYDYTRQIQYDSVGRLTKHTKNYSGIEYSYDNCGQLEEKQTDVLEEGANSVAVTQYRYNEKKELTQVTDASGNAWKYSWNMEGTLRATQDPEKRIGAYTYDLMDRVTSYTFGGELNQELSYDRNGNIVLMKNGAGETTSIAYNSLNQPVSVTDPMGSTTRYEYNRNGELRKRIDPMGNEFVYSQNNQGLIDKITDPAGGVFSYAYDAAGNPTKIESAEKRSKAMEYDALNRVVRLTDEGGNERKYTYYKHSLKLQLPVIRRELPTGRYEDHYYDSRCSNMLGSVNSSASPSGGFGYGRTFHGLISQASGADLYIEMKYDKLLRMTWLQYKIYNGPVLEEFQHMYDKTGKLMLVASGTGQDMTAVEYAYNKQGRVYRIFRKNADINFEYDKAGRKTKVGYETWQIDKRISYYPGGLVKSEWLEKQGNILYKASYEYNKNGFMTKKIESMNPARRGDPRGRPQSRDTTAEITTYDYDGLGRLIKAAYPDGETEEFTYDADGNRTALNSKNFGIIKYEYNTAGEMVKMTVGNTVRVGADLKSARNPGDRQEVTYTYDQEGSLTVKSGAENASYTYDALGRLKKVFRDGNTVEYTYDPFGRRHTRKWSGPAGSGEERFYYVGDNIFEVRDNTKGSKKIILGLNIDENYGEVDQNDNVRYFFQDYLGSVKFEFDKDGNILTMRRYRAFGEEPYDRATGFGFTGREWDEEAGHYFYRSRYYDPRVGRFMQRDRFNENSILNKNRAVLYDPAQLNDWGYVRNNPVIFNDPFGLWAVGIGFTGFAGFVAGGAVSMQFVLDDEGNFGVLLTGVLGGMTPGAGLAITGSYWNADNINQLRGFSWQGGGSYSVGVDITGGNDYQGFDVNYSPPGFSVPLPEGHGLIGGAILLWNSSIRDLLNRIESRTMGATCLRQ